MFLVGRILLRSILAEALGCGPAEISFSVTRHGKPVLAQELFLEHQVRFNLSHCATHYLVGMSRHGDIGVDVETVRSYHPRLPGRFFRPDEVRALERLSPDARPAAFFHLWVTKEACIKALGEPLGPTLPSIPTSLEMRGRHLDLSWEAFDLAPTVKAGIAVRTDESAKLKPGLIAHLDPADFLAAVRESER